MKEKPTTKLCKHCKVEIPAGAKVCPYCRKKQSSVLKWIGIVFFIFIIIGALGGNGDKKDSTTQTANSSDNKTTVSETNTTKESTEQPEEQEEQKEEIKDKYNVGDTWENKTLRMIYTDAYEFTDYNQYNAPADGNKIICAEFEFENIGKSDTTVMYTDFHGYADGYEVNQSYAPDGTGLDFTVKMSAGRKGTGKVAFEVPEDATEIEIEFSPNFWTSENVIFVYE